MTLTLVRLGRPIEYDPELGHQICERIAEGESLHSVCRDPNMPDKRSVIRWALRIPEFEAMYACAREIRTMLLSEEIIDIADQSQGDWRDRVGADGEVLGREVDHEYIRRSQLRVDARKWVLSKLLPRQYGEKTEIDIKGQALGGPNGSVRNIDSANVTDEQRARAMHSLIARYKAEKARVAS